jgi:hypothetical protein
MGVEVVAVVGAGVMEVEVAVEVAATDLAAVAMVLAGDVEDTLLSV